MLKKLFSLYLIGLFYFDFSISNSFSQSFGSGYLVTNKNDTLRGYIGLKNIYEVKFKPTFDSKEISSFSPYTSNGFGIDSQIYISFKIRPNESKVFLREIEKGYTSLYYEKNPDMGDLFYLVRNGVITKVNKPYFTGFVKAYFKDCPTLINDTDAALEKYDYSAESLIELVKDYNNCNNNEVKISPPIVTYSEKEQFQTKPYENSNDEFFNKDLYVRLSIGYGFSAGGQDLSINQLFLGLSPREIVYGSLGKGLKFSLGTGLKLNKNIGLDFSLTYSHGASYFGNTIFPIDSVTGFNVPYSIKGKSLTFSPSIFVITNNKNLNFYCRMGPILGFASSTTSLNMGRNFPPIRTLAFEYSGGLATGIASALGLNIKISDGFTLFGEVFYEGISSRPEKFTAVGIANNGQQSPPQNLPLAKDSYFSSNAYPSPILPFSSIGINFGLKFILD